LSPIVSAPAAKNLEEAYTHLLVGVDQRSNTDIDLDLSLDYYEPQDKVNFHLLPQDY
jgi:hypothetical protein